MNKHRYFCVAFIFMNGFICAMEPVESPIDALVTRTRELGKYRSEDEEQWKQLFSEVAACHGRQGFVDSDKYSLKERAVSLAVANGFNNRFIAALIDAGFEFDKGVSNWHSPAQLAVGRWNCRGQDNRPLVTLQLLLERGASVSPQGQWNTLSQFLATMPRQCSSSWKTGCWQPWIVGTKYLLALGADPGERPVGGDLETGVGQDAPYMEVLAKTYPNMYDLEDCAELVCVLRAHVPEEKVRLLLQRQLVWNSVVNSMQIEEDRKQKLRHKVFNNLLQVTVDDWTQNGQMRLHATQGGFANWCASKWNERDMRRRLECYLDCPEELRPRVEADLKYQLALWAAGRRKINLKGSH